MFALEILHAEPSGFDGLNWDFPVSVKGPLAYELNRGFGGTLGVEYIKSPDACDDSEVAVDPEVSPGDVWSCG